MAVPDPIPRTGRSLQADRIAVARTPRFFAGVWLPAVVLFAAGWLVSRGAQGVPADGAGVGLPEAVALQVPLLAALVLTVHRAWQQRPRRVVWSWISVALVLAAVSGVVFCLLGGHDDRALRIAGVVGGLLAELGLGAAALSLVRARPARLPSSGVLDLVVVAAGGVTFALLVGDPGRTGGTSVLLTAGELALGMGLTLIVVQLIMTRVSREPFLMVLAAALALRQVVLVEQGLVLRADPASATGWLDPAWAGLGFALTIAGLAWMSGPSVRPRPSGARRRADGAAGPTGPAGPTGDQPERERPEGERPEGERPGRERAARGGLLGGWTVPAGCMALAVVVLVWFAQLDGPRPAVLVACAGLTLAAGLAKAVRSSRDLERLDRQLSAGDTDTVSGLLGRRAATGALAWAGRRGPGAVLLIDIDRFRDVNHYLGLEAADEVLRQLGRRLADTSGPDETVGRLGADEFILIVPAATGNAAMNRARQVRSLVEFPFPIGEDRVRLDISIGVALWGASPPPADELLSQAHRARVMARDRGTAVERWDPERDALGARRLALADSLRRSVHREELLLHYQPQVDIRTGEVVAVEALARWSHDGEMVPPDLFIPMAEEAGLIGDLTRSLLDQALQQVARWDEQGIRLSVAVNLSPRNLTDLVLPRRVARLLERHGIDPTRLVLEITETTLMPDTGRVSEVLERLRRLGVRVSIDDYGTGHAALTYLRDFTVDELKLDRTYVSAMTEDERTLAIVGSTVAMGRRLGLEVVAEGVESEAQLEALAACGCHLVQGYLLCPPRPVDELTAWLRNREGSPLVPPTPR